MQSTYKYSKCAVGGYILSGWTFVLEALRKFWFVLLQLWAAILLYAWCWEMPFCLPNIRFNKSEKNKI